MKRLMFALLAAAALAMPAFAQDPAMPEGGVPGGAAETQQTSPAPQAPAGIPGPQGVQGPVGPQGPAGRPGRDCFCGGKGGYHRHATSSYRRATRVRRSYGSYTFNSRLASTVRAYGADVRWLKQDSSILHREVRGVRDRVSSLEERVTALEKGSSSVTETEKVETVPEEGTEEKKTTEGAEEEKNDGTKKKKGEEDQEEAPAPLDPNSVPDTTESLWIRPAKSGDGIRLAFYQPETDADGIRLVQNKKKTVTPAGQPAVKFRVYEDLGAEDGERGLRGATVLVWPFTGGKPGKAITNAKGEVAFALKPEVEYDIQVSVPEGSGYYVWDTRKTANWDSHSPVKIQVARFSNLYNHVSEAVNAAEAAKTKAADTASPESIEKLGQAVGALDAKVEANKQSPWQFWLILAAVVLSAVGAVAALAGGRSH